MLPERAHRWREAAWRAEAASFAAPPATFSPSRDGGIAGLVLQHSRLCFWSDQNVSKSQLLGDTVNLKHQSCKAKRFVQRGRQIDRGNLVETALFATVRACSVQGTTPRAMALPLAPPPCGLKGGSRKMHWILLMSLVVLIPGCAGAGEPKHLPRFAFDRHESPLNLPLTLRVRSVSPPPSDFPLCSEEPRHRAAR